MANVAVDNIVAVLEGRQPPNCWNAEIYQVIDFERNFI